MTKWMTVTTTAMKTLMSKYGLQCTKFLLGCYVQAVDHVQIIIYFSRFYMLTSLLKKIYRVENLDNNLLRKKKLHPFFRFFVGGMAYTRVGRSRRRFVFLARYAVWLVFGCLDALA